VRPRALFISDLHLRGADDPRAALFRRFLDEAAARAESGADGKTGAAVALYILGDLFHYWLERGDRIIPAHAAIVADLAAATRRGLAVRLLSGNRDFLYGEYLTRAAGVELLGERAEIELGGKHVLLTHGDTFYTRDRGYRFWRRVVRSLPARLAARTLPFGFVAFAAERFSRGSAAARARKPPSAFVIDEAALLAEFARGIDVIICGHIHQAERRTLALPPAAPGGATRSGELWVLGAWSAGESGAGSAAEGGAEQLSRRTVEQEKDSAPPAQLRSPVHLLTCSPGVPAPRGGYVEFDGREFALRELG